MTHCEINPSPASNILPLPVRVVIRMLFLWRVGLKCVFVFVIVIFFILTVLAVLWVIISSVLRRRERRLQDTNVKTKERKKPSHWLIPSVLSMWFWGLCIKTEETWTQFMNDEDSGDYLCDEVIPNAEVRWDELLLENRWNFLLNDRTVLGTIRSLSLHHRFLFWSAARWAKPKPSRFSVWAAWRNRSVWQRQKKKKNLFDIAASLNSALIPSHRWISMYKPSISYIKRHQHGHLNWYGITNKSPDGNVLNFVK